MTELRPGATPAELVPGDPEAVAELAARLSRFAHSAGEAGQRLAALDSGHWSGSAAEAFRDAVGEVPAAFRGAAQAFGAAATALAGYARQLHQARGRAAEAVRLVEEAETRSTAWRAAGAIGADPGEPLRQQATAQLRRERDQLRATAESARRHLAEAAAHAPSGRADLVTGPVPGIRTATAEITLHVDHPLEQPSQYVAPLDQVVGDVHFGADHQVPFAGAATPANGGWEQWAAHGAGRSVGTIGAQTLAAAGVVAVVGGDGRQRHTALQTAGADPETLRRQGVVVRQRRHPATGPSQVAGAWRTNLAGHSRSSGMLRVWSGRDANPLARTIPSPAVTLGFGGEVSSRVVPRSGPPAEENPAAPGARS